MSTQASCKDNSTSHVNPYRHNVSIEVMKNKNETLERGAQLRDYYVKLGYYLPTKLNGGINAISHRNDSSRSLEIALCDPGTTCVPYTFNQFTVAVDNQTKV